MENQDLITTDETTKEELERIKYISVMQPDNTNGNNMYLQNILNSTNSENEAIQNWEDKEVHYEERYVPVRNETYKQDEVIADKIVIDKINTKIINKRTRRSNRLLVNDKKENLKTTICGKVLKQKRMTKKSNKTVQDTISNEMLTMVYKKIAAVESQKYSMLPSFGSIRPNNPNKTLHIPYGIAKQKESHYNYSRNNNRNMLQSLDYNNLRHENLKQPTLVNSNPWSIASKNGQNFILNNIANTQNQVGQTGFINDKQYHNPYTADYSKQNENLYYSSIKSKNSHQLSGIENKVFRCSCNDCTSNMWNNMHTGVEVFQKKEIATCQQIANNNILSYIPPTTVIADTYNTAVGSFNYSHNYQSLHADYNFKRLFHSGFNTINKVNINGYNVMAKRNIMSPLNNWNPHINHSIPYNSNTNVTLDASIPSEPLPSSSFYTGNNSIQFSNYYNKDLMKMDMSQYKERDNFNPSTMTSFENSLPTINMHGLDSESTHTSSQNSTSTNENGIIYDITNFISETNTPNGSQESPSYVYAKEMDKNWSSFI
ncbi:hypothetical protein ACFW04_006383 [Cataglyphis niger]